MTVLSRRERTAETRRVNKEALLEATRELLDEGVPFAGIGIEQLVRRAGLSRPTFYAYFDDKRALVLHLGRAALEDVDAAARAWLAGADTPVRLTLEAVLEAFRAHRSAMRAVIEAATYDEEVAAFWVAFHEHFAAAARARIATGCPDLPAAAVSARAFALVWMTERSMVENVLAPSVEEAALLDELARFWDTATSS